MKYKYSMTEEKLGLIIIADTDMPISSLIEKETTNFLNGFVKVGLFKLRFFIFNNETSEELKFTKEVEITFTKHPVVQLNSKETPNEF